MTFTVVNWIDMFIRNEYKDIVIDSIKYCQKKKGLEVYAWVIMTSHIHMIIGTIGQNELEGIIRDLKSFTSKSIHDLLKDQNVIGESRREWLLWMFKRAGIKNSNNKDYQFWQQNSHPVELNTNELMDQKLEYIHMNPVNSGFVSEPESWIYSSAGDYAGMKGMIDILFIE